MSQTTLALVTSRLIARIDIDPRAASKILRIEVKSRTDNASWLALVDSALAMGTRRPRQVWLFSEAFWTGRIRIPYDLHGWANSDELNQAAMLEAETLSGIPAFESKLAMVRIAGEGQTDPEYWATQIEDSDFRQIDQAFQAANVSWSGMAHPYMHAPERVDDGDPNVLQLSDELAIRNWAEEIAQRLRKKERDFPVLAPPAMVLSQQTQTRWAAFFAVVSIAVCVFLYANARDTLRQIEQSTQNLTKQMEESEQLQLALQKSELRMSENRKLLLSDQVRYGELANLAEVNRFNALLRQGHCSNLIEAIAASADQDSWLQAIESESGKSSLVGIALSEASAHRFASDLSMQACLVGHAIGPAQTRAMADGLFEFVITVETVAARSQSLASQKSTP